MEEQKVDIERVLIGEEFKKNAQSLPKGKASGLNGMTAKVL